MYQLVLRSVQILKFIHQKVGDAGPDFSGKFLVVTQQADAGRNNLIQIKQVALAQAAKIRPQRVGFGIAFRQLRLAGEEERGLPPDVLPLALGKLRVALADYALPHLRPGQRELRTATAQPAQTEAVEGLDQRGLLAHAGGQPLPDFLCRFVRKRDDDQRPLALLQQADSPPHQRVRLAGARPGLNDDPVGIAVHSGLLLRVEQAAQRLWLALILVFETESSLSALLLFSWLGRAQTEKIELTAQLGPLVFGKDLDHSEFTVIAGLADDLAFPHPLHGLGEQGRNCCKLRQRRVQQQAELRAEGVDQPSIGFIHPLAGRAAAEQLAEHFRQRNEAADCGRVLRPERLVPISQFQHPVQHADRQGFAAARTNAFGRAGLLRLKAHAAAAAAVAVVFALFRVEFDGRRQPLPAAWLAQGLAQGEEIKARREDVRLAA